MKTFATALVAVFLCSPAFAQVGADDSLFSSVTTHVVTDCGESGPGTLREAVENTSGRRNVEFSVSCDIGLDQGSDITVLNGQVWVRGETAPPPGVTIRGMPFDVRAGQVKITNVAFRTGVGGNATLQDSVSINGVNPSGGPNPAGCTGQPDRSHIILDHISATWSQDEVVQIWGCNVNNVTVSNSIIGEGLNNSGHPDGQHSMGMIVGPGNQNVLIYRNLFVSNKWRNPVVHGCATAAIVNNLVYNAGNQGIHFYGHSGYTCPTVFSMVNNLEIEGPSSRNKQYVAQSEIGPLNAGSQGYWSGNLVENYGTLLFEDVQNLTRLASDPFTYPAWVNPVSAYVLEPTLINCSDPAASDVGPLYKDATDVRLITEVCNRGGSIKDAPPPGE